MAAIQSYLYFSSIRDAFLCTEAHFSGCINAINRVDFETGRSRITRDIQIHRWTQISNQTLFVAETLMDFRRK